jgi:predicted DNA-binding transcriptional regulator AlpA
MARGGHRSREEDRMTDDASLPVPKATAPLPILPRILRAELAALYCGVGPSTFRAEVGAGRAPQPVHMTDGVKGWDRHDLDQWIEVRKEAQARKPNSWDRVL